MNSYSPGLPRALTQEKKESGQFLKGLRPQCLQGTSEMVYEFLNTVPVCLLWHLMVLARGSHSTIFWNQEAPTGLDKPNDVWFVLTQQVLYWASGGHNKVVLLFSRPSDQRAEGTVPPHSHPENKWVNVHTPNTTHCLLYDCVHISFIIHQLLNRQQKIPHLSFQEIN